MLEIHLFGKLRKLLDNSSVTTDSILRIEEKLDETLEELIHRIGIKSDELGELFINGNVCKLNSLVPPNARIGIFPLGMHLLCGGQHLKGHGYIMKRTEKIRDYWQKNES